MKTMLIQRHIFLLVSVLLTSFSLFSPLSVFATKFTLETPSVLVGTDTDFVVSVFVDTQVDSLNAFSGELSFPNELLALSRIRESGSLVSVWLDTPKATDPSHIFFSGITPGGYRGERGLLFEITFHTSSEGKTAEFVLTKLQAFKNDGSATPAPVSANILRVLISKTATSSQIAVLEDGEPPEQFPIQVAQSPDAFEGKKVLIFATQDKGTGLAYYEVCEGLFASCKRAESPYVLKHQWMDVFLTVNAYDQSGNMRTEKLSTFSAIARYSLYGILGILVVLQLFFMLFRKR